jgi:uncharacterized protein (TIGR00730 family)
MNSVRICVFCGASSGVSPQFVAEAGELGTALAAAGYGLVFGAGGAGIMGAVSDAVLKADGEVVGVIPQALMDRECGRTDIADLRVVSTMHERKALMHELSAAFVTLPGGLGTLEEFFEVLTWAQLGLHRKPMIILNVAGYYTPLAELLDHAVRQGFMTEKDRTLVTFVDTAAQVITALGQHQLTPTAT